MVSLHLILIIKQICMLRYPPHVAARVTANRIRSAVRRAADPLHLPRIPQTIEELSQLMGENPHITATMDGADNIFLGMVGPPRHRSLIFLSRRVAAMLCREDMRQRIQIVFSDGTFASRPSRPRFHQVFQISTSIDNHVSDTASSLKRQGSYQMHFHFSNCPRSYSNFSET